MGLLECFSVFGIQTWILVTDIICQIRFPFFSKTVFIFYNVFFLFSEKCLFHDFAHHDARNSCIFLPCIT